MIVIVLSILGAFMLESWQENVRDSKLEKEYLQRFLQDLHRDSVDIAQVRNSAMLCVRMSSDLLDTLDIPIESYFQSRSYFETANQDVRLENSTYTFQTSRQRTEDIGGLLTRVSRGRLFDHATSTFDDLTDGGRIDLISNQELRRDIQLPYEYLLMLS